MKTSWRHHSRCLEDVFKRSWRRLQNVLKAFWRYLKDVFLLKTSWRRLSKKPWRCLKDVLQTSWRCLEGAFARRLEDVLKTYDQDEYIGFDQSVLKKSSENIWVRWIYLPWSRSLEDVSWRQRRMTSSRRLESVCLSLKFSFFKF